MIQIVQKHYLYKHGGVSVSSFILLDKNALRVLVGPTVFLLDFIVGSAVKTQLLIQYTYLISSGLQSVFFYKVSLPKRTPVHIELNYSGTAYMLSELGDSKSSPSSCSCFHMFHPHRKNAGYQHMTYLDIQLYFSVDHFT